MICRDSHLALPLALHRRMYSLTRSPLDHGTLPSIFHPLDAVHGTMWPFTRIAATCSTRCSIGFQSRSAPRNSRRASQCRLAETSTTLLNFGCHKSTRLHLPRARHASTTTLWEIFPSDSPQDQSWTFEQLSFAFFIHGIECIRVAYVGAAICKAWPNQQVYGSHRARLYDLAYQETSHPRGNLSKVGPRTACSKTTCQKTKARVYIS